MRNNKLLCVLLAVLAFILFGQFIARAQNPNTAKFPSAVATDTDMLVATNSARSTLTAGIDNVTLSVPVADGTKFVTPTVVTIGAEAIKICSKSGNTLTACASGRAFRGAAASHNNGDTVVGYIDQTYPNQASAEIQAIETALGAGAWSSGNRTAHLLFGADNTWDIGALAANRPRQIYAAGSVKANGFLFMSNGSGFLENGDGILTMYNSASTSFNRLMFGGTTASFPSLKRNAAAIDVRLADDSGYAGLNTGAHSMSGHLTFGTDNTWDIGASGATRPRALYLAGTATIGGSVGIAQSSPGSPLHITGNNTLDAPQAGIILGRFWTSATDSRASAIYHYYDSTSSAREKLVFAITADTTPYAANRAKMWLDQAGKLTIGIPLTTNATYDLQLQNDSAGKPTTNTWTITSDARVKTNIRPFVDGLDIVRQINPVVYELNGKAGLPAGATGIGVIAQDVQPVAPYMIGSYKARLNPADTTDTDILNFQSHALPFILINAMHDLEKQTFVQTIAGEVEPVCSETERGHTRFWKDDVLGDQIKACGRAADGTYAWRVTTQF